VLKEASVIVKQLTGQNADSLILFNTEIEESSFLKELCGGWWYVLWQNTASVAVAGLVY
jgi:hypothetical protein